MIAKLFSGLDVGGWFALRMDHPVWLRDFARWPDEDAGRVEQILQALGARHVVVGHTVQKGEIQTRFRGRVFLIDTGILAAVYGGKPATLEIAGGRFTAIYPDERRVLLEPGEE